MTYFDLVSSYIKRNGGDSALIAAVADYLENTHAQDEPPWSQEYDNVCQAAVAYANSKRERLRKHKRVAEARSPAPNSRHRQSLAQERHAIRLALRQPNSVSAHRSMLVRLEELEKTDRQFQEKSMIKIPTWYVVRADWPCSDSWSTEKAANLWQGRPVGIPVFNRWEFDNAY
jgi:hypothetical protein